MAPWMAIGSLPSQFQAAEFTSWLGLGVQAVPVDPPVELLPPLPVVWLPPVPLPELFPVPVPELLPVPLPELLPVPVVSGVVAGLAQPKTDTDPSKAKRTRNWRIGDLLRSMKARANHAKRFEAQ
jgi:hypothetical protein